MAVVPDGDIQNIKRAVEAALPIEPHPFLRCGETVRVVRGPMQGVSGILLRRKNDLRLVVSVELLAQSAAIEVGSQDLEPVAIMPCLQGTFTTQPGWRPRLSAHRTGCALATSPS